MSLSVSTQSSSSRCRLAAAPLLWVTISRGSTTSGDPNPPVLHPGRRPTLHSVRYSHVSGCLEALGLHTTQPVVESLGVRQNRKRGANTVSTSLRGVGRH